MKIVSGKVEVRLDLTEVGQNIEVPPSLVAHSFPLVVILGYAAKPDLSVDGARTANNFPARQIKRLLHRRSQRFITPGMLVDVVRLVPRPNAVFDIVWQPLERRVVRTRFKEQH